MISMFNFLTSLSIALWAFIFEVSAAPSGSIWTVNIHEEPAPSPQDGPPQDVNAIRDPSYLPLQIGSIIGSYLVWLLLTGIAIITIGRRLRRAAQSSPRSLNMEIMSPSAKQVQPDQLPKAFDPSPLSPAKSNPWDPSPVSPTKKSNPWSPKLGSWGFRKHKRQDSMQSSVMTFDESVISEDRMKNEIEMDRLYAAVAEHEAETTQAKAESQESSPTSPQLPNPPELQHLRYATRQPEFPLSPPPENEIERSPTSPTVPSRESTGTPRRLNKKPPPLSFNNPPSRNSSRSSFASFRSFGKKRGASVRELPISPPMGSPDMAPDGTYSEAEPLTPRHYRPGPPPTPPMRSEALASPQAVDGERRFYFSPSIRSSRSSIATGGFSPAQTPRTATFPVVPPPMIAEEQNRAGVAITIDTATNSRIPATAAGPAPSLTPPKEKSHRAKPTPLTLPGSVNTSQSTLPLRTAPLPFRSLRSPNSTRPISQIRTQEITRPDPGKLRAPGTAMPTTPYSPFYMPQTPLTPMTPSRLVTREERKRAKREEGRRVLTEEDRVPEDDELWGEGY